MNIHYDGNVAWTYGGIFATSCELILTNYPFDQQTCSIVIENWAYTKDDVELVNGTQGITLSDYLENGIWKYTSSSVDLSYFYHDVHINSSYPRITFSMDLTRKSHYYLNAIMIPCIMILLVALCVFWLPPESGEKIGLGITVALAFSVFQIVINSITPATSEYSPVLGECINNFQFWF